MCFFILQPYPPHTHNLHPQHFTSSTLSTCLQVFLHVRHLVQQAATPDMFSINIKSGEGVFLSSFSFIFYRCYISCNSVSLILRLHRRIIFSIYLSNASAPYTASFSATIGITTASLVHSILLSNLS